MDTIQDTYPNMTVWIHHEGVDIFPKEKMGDFPGIVMLVFRGCNISHHEEFKGTSWRLESFYRVLVGFHVTSEGQSV